MPLVALLGMLVAVPLTIPSGWQVLAYRAIPPNTVAFVPQGLTISVDQSASPVVYALPQSTLVTGLRARGQVSGRLQTTAALQGGTGHDDFVLRIGLVEAGSRRPSFVQRRLAPRWIRQLFALAPPGAGIEQIRFFSLGLDASQIGWARRHPLSDLLFEEVVAVPDERGGFAIDLTLDPIETLAVWLAADGDDTGSRFEVRLEELTLARAGS